MPNWNNARQDAYRFRHNNGDEAGATWMAAANTPVTVSPGDTFRLRFRVRSQGGMYGQTNIIGAALQWTFTETGSGNRFWLRGSPLSAENTMPRIGAPSGDYAFLPGQLVGVGLPGFPVSPNYSYLQPNGISLGQYRLDYSEFEWSLRFEQAATWQTDAIPAGAFLTFYVLPVPYPWSPPQGSGLIFRDIDASCQLLGAPTSRTVYPAALAARTAILRPTSFSYPTPATAISQGAYRFRVDNGNEQTATWLAPEYANASLPRQGECRVRIKLYLPRSNWPIDILPKLQYRLAGSDWDDVSFASPHVRPAGSDWVQDRAPTTWQLFTGPQYTDYGGELRTMSGAASKPWTLVSESAREFEFSIGLQDSLGIGSVIELRLADYYSREVLYPILIPTITVGGSENRTLYPETLVTTAAILSPWRVLGAAPSVVNGTGAVLAPVPKVTKFPSVLSATAAVIAPTVVIVPDLIVTPATLNATAAALAPTIATTIFPSTLDAAAAVETPGADIDQTDATKYPAALDAPAALLTPTPLIPFAAETLDAPSELLASTPIVIVHPAVLEATGALLALAGWIKSPDTFELTAALQTSTRKVTVTPSVLQATAALQTPLRPILPAVLEAVADLEDPLVYSYLETEDGYPRIAETT